MRKLLLLLLAAITPLLQAEQDLVSFEASMLTSRDFNPAFSRQDPHWRLLKALYELYTLKRPAENPLIPHRIHFIWLGSPLPSKCQKFIETWRLFHPDWRVQVWQDQDVDAFQMKNRAAFDAAKNYGEKSDIWRYEILERFGGVYADTDFECLKSFDEIHATCTFYTGVAYDREVVLFNGLIGAQPHHPIMKACIEAIEVGPGDNIPHHIMNRTGPYFFTRCFFKQAAHASSSAVVFPVTYFYPFPGTERRTYTDSDRMKQVWVKPESFALHHWGQTWVPHELRGAK